MGLLGDFLAQIDNRKRVAANSIRGLLADPVGHLGLLGARYAEQNLPTMREAQDAESVMPGMADPFRAKIENLAMNSGLLGITGWHGSPHRFPPTPRNPLGEFDPTKIGTGEGAQAYGHGHYIAESPGVAKYYTVADENAFPVIRKGADRLDLMLRESSDQADNKIYSAISAITKRGTTLDDDALRAAKDRLRLDADYFAGSPAGQISDKAFAKFDEVAPKLKGARFEYDPGNLYKVDLPDDAIAKMLDWDAPLSKQPKAVREAFKPLVDPVRKVMNQRSGKEWGDLAGPQKYDPTGQELARLLAQQRTSLDAQTVLSGGLGPEVSERLRSMGIPGIKYLDAGSRGKGDGTRNFVVFPGNEGLLKILERE